MDHPLAVDVYQPFGNTDQLESHSIINEGGTRTVKLGGGNLRVRVGPPLDFLLRNH